MTKTNNLDKSISNGQRSASPRKPLEDEITDDRNWIDLRLQALYGSVLDEPLPDEIIELLWRKP